jgi:hypothetical protein
MLLKYKILKNLLRYILVAATDLGANLGNWFMSRAPFIFTVKHAFELEEVTLSSSCEENSRPLHVSALHEQRYVLNVM